VTLTPARSAPVRRRGKPVATYSDRQGPTTLDAASRHLVKRFSGGLTPTLVAQVKAAGGGRTWFEKQLQATITHPAMGLYLDNAFSSRESPNENLGRELLELHTVGVDAGYTEDHVKASARTLTGYRVDLYYPSFRAWYDTGWHDTQPVEVMGFSHPNGAADGRPATMAYLSYLAKHPGHREPAGPQVVRQVRVRPAHAGDCERGGPGRRRATSRSPTPCTGSTARVGSRRTSGRRRTAIPRSMPPGRARVASSPASRRTATWPPAGGPPTRRGSPSPPLSFRRCRPRSAR
jgi:hypothetical protein